ncbi:MAG: hypothetical protein GXP29_15655 [Planctomycetes bacterium]|nr:hypothetical protein [Planctomycetota bacterium]
MQIRILDNEHQPQDYEGKQYLNCVVRIDSLTLRPGIEEIGSPPAIDKLFARFEEVTLKKRRRSKVATAEK